MSPQGHTHAPAGCFFFAHGPASHGICATAITCHAQQTLRLPALISNGSACSLTQLLRQHHAPILPRRQQVKLRSLDVSLQHLQHRSMFAAPHPSRDCIMPTRSPGDRCQPALSLAPFSMTSVSVHCWGQQPGRPHLDACEPQLALDVRGPAVTVYALFVEGVALMHRPAIHRAAGTARGKATGTMFSCGSARQGQRRALRSTAS